MKRSMQRHSLQRLTLTVLATAISATSASAQQTGTSRDSAGVRLAPLVTTATRAPARSDEIAQRVSVVDSVQIATIPGLDVADLLKRAAGLDIVQYPSLLAGVGMRGFRPQLGVLSTHTLLLVDGRPADVTNLALLDLAGIERIEVLKGAASALYGSSAVAGVVNVITRRTLQGRTASLSAAGGSFSTSEAIGHAGGLLADRVDGDIDGHFYREGSAYRIGNANTFRRALGAGTATRIFPDGTRVEIDEPGNGIFRDGANYKYGSGAARLGVALDGGLRVDGRVDGFAATDVQTPGDINFGDDQNGFENLHRGGGELSLSGVRSFGTFRLRAYGGQESSEYFNDASDTRFVSFTSVTNTSGAQLELTTQLSGVVITAGADATRAQATSSLYTAANVPGGTYSPDSRNGSAALFAEGRTTLFGGHAILNLGARLDRVGVSLLDTPLRPDVRASSNAFTVFDPSAGVVIPIAGGLRAHGSVGRGFVTPDAFARAGLTQSAPVKNVVAIAVGNASLVPEHAITLDGGIGLSATNGFDADITVFNTNVRDRITSASASYAAGSRPTTVEGFQISRVRTSVNAGSAILRGVEASAGYDIGAALHRSYRLRASAEYTRLLTAVERTRAASLDTTGAGNRSGVDPASLATAFVFGAESEQQVLNVARATVTGALEYDDFSLLRGRLGARYVGRRRDNDFSDYSIFADVEYPPFLVLDATGGVKLADRLRLDLTVANLTDENYYEKRGYNLPGRALKVRVTAAY